MYEEGDDNLPSSYRLLEPTMQTTSPQMDHLVEPYLANEFAMSAMLARANKEWRQNMTDKLLIGRFLTIATAMAIAIAMTVTKATSIT
jgi:hypothetical protein